jgi:cobalamin biosynthesis protein CobT
MEATTMKLIGVISTAVLSMTLGIAAPAYAQQEQHDQHDQQEEQKAKPTQDEKKAQPAKQGEKSAQQDKNTNQEEKNAQQEKKNPQQEEKNVQQQDKNSKQEEKNALQARPEQPAQHAGGGRIPEDRYKANFGQEHRFRVSQADYSRDHRFQYGGYWFELVDLWPSNWLYTQDVFVVEINGVYYLCNPMYPGVNITLSVAE